MTTGCSPSSWLALGLAAGRLASAGSALRRPAPGRRAARRAFQRDQDRSPATFATTTGRRDVVDSRDVTVNVDHTTEPARRERVQISWSGRPPQRWPRGRTRTARTGSSRSTRSSSCSAAASTTRRCPRAAGLARDVLDVDASAAVAVDATPPSAVWRTTCTPPRPTRSRRAGCRRRPGRVPRHVPTSRPHLTPFVAASGKVYAACTADDDAAGGRRSAPRSRRPRWRRSPTPTATGRSNFEVRSDIENESLGCSDTVPCSIVVIPIMGISCVDADTECRRTGRFAPGSEQLRQRRASTSRCRPLYWWSASNWRNRVAVPLDVRPAAGRVRRARHARPHRLLRLRADEPGFAAVVARRTAWTRSGSSSSTTGCPTRPPSPGRERRRRRPRSSRARTTPARRCRSATRRRRSPASRSATSSTARQHRASAPTCSSTPGCWPSC